jgi:hypothetical protein
VSSRNLSVIIYLPPLSSVVAVAVVDDDIVDVIVDIVVGVVTKVVVVSELPEQRSEPSKVIETKSGLVAKSIMKGIISEPDC